MKYPLQALRCRRSAGLSITVCLFTVLVCGVAVAPRADQAADTRERFIELDSELQAIKEEILAINRDILLLEEMSLYPRGRQFVVLVSVAPGSGLSPARISLDVDGETVGRHDYSQSERTALLDGGVHRLYSGGLSEGRHRLEVSLTGSRAGNKAFTQRRSLTIQKRPGRKYLELHLGPGEKKSEPAVILREWQQ